MEREVTLYQQLNNLSALDSEETLEKILSILWKTRKTGLRSPEKSHIQSLLNLPSPGDVDPVLACLRSLIRKFVHQNISGDDFLKLFPPDISFDLQSMLIMVFQKYQNQWKEDVSTDQPSLPRTSVSCPVRTSMPPSFASFPSSDISTSQWARQDDFSARYGCDDLGASTIIFDDCNVSRLAPVSLHVDAAPLNNLGLLPRLKSMTWTMENPNSPPANRVAVVTLKLQDYTKSPLGEIDVKFQLTRDTLEAMLRSMTYINEQLSNIGGTSSEPAQKKQRQSDNLS